MTPPTPERVEEIERETGNDLAAFVDEAAETLGTEGRWLQHGLTSSDVLDTTLAVQLKEATTLLLSGVDRVMAAVKKRALEHKRTPMMGRSHGIHAEPVTFGLKLAGWYDAWSRRRAALLQAARTASVGKISGAVGTFANVDPRVEALVMEKLGLPGAEAAATQVTITTTRPLQYSSGRSRAGAARQRPWATWASGSATASATRSKSRVARSTARACCFRCGSCSGADSTCAYCVRRSAGTARSSGTSCGPRLAASAR